MISFPYSLCSLAAKIIYLSTGEMNISSFTDIMDELIRFWKLVNISSQIGSTGYN